MLELGEGIMFSDIYRPKRVIIKDGRLYNDFENQTFDPELIRLWRYVTLRQDAIPAWAWWSELETEYPRISGEATGIGDHECVWRAQWAFPASEALTNLHIGETRWSEVGVIREYNNKVDIPAGQLTWTKMQPR